MKTSLKQIAQTLGCMDKWVYYCLCDNPLVDIVDGMVYHPVGTGFVQIAGHVCLIYD